ncbi:MAG: TonB-dependent receptor [Candidatus Omnitrophica bacterium]|nr:TonB-dependent receptor [Candidatus Omnitrophota bacterium]
MKNKFLLVLVCLLAVLVNAEWVSAEENHLAPIVVTASRIGQSDYKLSSNVTVIDLFDIEHSTAKTVPQILEQVQGIYVYDRGSVKTTTIDMRGFGDTAKSNVLVLVNDRKTNSIDISGADLLQIPLEDVERIEIIRGAGSVLYGDNAVGGVINIITKKGKGKLSGQVESYYGSYDKKGGNVQLSGSEKGLSYYFHSKYADDRGYRTNSDVVSGDFNTRLGYDLGNHLGLDFEYGLHKDNYQLPGGLDENELVSLGRRGSADIGDHSNTHDEFYKATVSINPWPEEIKGGKIALDYTHRNREVFDSFFSGTWNTDRYMTTDGILGKYMFDSQVFGRQVNWVTGIDTYTNQSIIVGSRFNTDNLVISKDEIGYYGSGELEVLEHLFANAGTRYQKANYTFNQRNGSADTKRDANAWVSMGGTRYEYAAGSNVHFNVQQTFRFLATDEWYSSWSGLDTTLNQQKGIQFEAGVKHNYHDWIEFDCTPYWIENRNEIFFDPNTFQDKNYDRTRRIGAENGVTFDLMRFVNYSWLSKLKYFMNYTYEIPEFINGVFDGKDIPMVPRSQAALGFNGQIFDKIDFSLLGHYVGQRYIINDVGNTMPKAKPYFVLGSKISYKPTKNFEVYLSLNNMLDKLYSSYEVKKTANTRDYFPAERFNVLAGIELKF